MLIGSHLPHPRHRSWEGTGTRRLLFHYARAMRSGHEALEVLTRCLQSGDDRIAMMAAQAILDRGYGRPTQSIDANINDDPVRYIVELPEKSATTEEWLESIRREDAGRSLVNGVAAAVEDEQTH